MELVKITLDSKNIEGCHLYINSVCESGIVEFEYKGILYVANVEELTTEQRKEGFKQLELVDKKPFNFTERDWINLFFMENWDDYTDQILVEHPHLWELDEERMWNEENTLTLANNTIQFKKPFDLFAGLEEGSELDIFTDGQNTQASPKDNPSPWIAEIEIDIRKWIESKAKEKEITELNQFEFVGKKWIKEIYFYFEGMNVVFKEEIENPYPNNCSICSGFVSDKDLYCDNCTQIED